MKKLLLLAAVVFSGCTQGRAADSPGPVTLTNLCVQTGGTSAQVDTSVVCSMTALKRYFSAQGSCYVLTVEGCTETVTANAKGVGTALTKITFIAGDGNSQDGKWFPHVGDFLNTRQVQGQTITIGFKGAVAQPDAASAYYYVDQVNGQLSLE